MNRQDEVLWSPETKSSLFVLSSIVIELKHDQTEKGRNNEVTFYNNAEYKEGREESTWSSWALISTAGQESNSSIRW